MHQDLYRNTRLWYAEGYVDMDGKNEVGQHGAGSRDARILWQTVLDINGLLKFDYQLQSAG